MTTLQVGKTHYKQCYFFKDVCKRARPNLQTVVVFLTTHVKGIDKDGKKKLKCAIHYLQASKDIVLTLEVNGSGVICWWVNAAFAVHCDMQSHTGSCLSLGKGGVFGLSQKNLIQKALLKTNWLVLTTSCPKFHGKDISLRHRDIL